MPVNVLGTLLKFEKVYHDTTNEQIAEKVGVTASSISRIISGETKKPDLDALIGLARYFGMSNVSVMIALIRPEAFDSVTKDHLIASWVKSLPEPERKIIDLALSGMIFESKD